MKKIFIALLFVFSTSVIGQTVVDSYSESNYSTILGLGGSNPRRGQSFTCTTGIVLNSVKFYLRRLGSPTGNIYAYLYTHTGSYGSSSSPGSLIASSDPIDVSTIGTSSSLITFTFSGVNKYAMSGSTNYCILTGGSFGDGSVNLIGLGIDASSPTHGGNYVYITGYKPEYDAIFYVYGDSSAVPYMLIGY